MRRKYMNYDSKFRAEAVKLSEELGIKKAAAQLGIPYYTLAEWRKHRCNTVVNHNSVDYSSLSKDQLIQLLEAKNQEITSLKKDKAETEQANEVLKDALGFFVKDRKK
jgi:transposase